MKLSILKSSSVIAALLALLIGSAHADLVINGNMSDPAAAGNGLNHFETEDVDLGWRVKNNSRWNNAMGTTGELTNNGDVWAVSQINSVTSESGSDLTLSFDWTPTATASNLNLRVQLVGWQGTLSASNQLFRFINTSSALTGGGGANHVDLLTGSSKGTGFDNSVSQMLVSAASAGTTLNFATTIDMSTYGAGFSDVSDYDYIGMRFSLDTALDAGSVLDNVGLIAAVPEPSSLALILLGTGLLFNRRRSAR